MNNIKGLSINDKRIKLGLNDYKSVLKSQNNRQNNDILKKEMVNKVNYSEAYYATNKTVKNINTDFDNFPYNRWYRGISTYTDPIIIEREAGYSNIKICKPVSIYRNALVQSGPRDSSEKQNFPRVLALNGFLENPESLSLDHCFEAAPSTVYPCYSRNEDYKAARFAVTASGEEVKYGVVISP